jgi:Rhodopirellula transposase.
MGHATSILTFTAHDAPYGPTWHPIEHRLFSQVERVLRVVMLDSPPTALNAIQRVSTQTGLSVLATILDQVYEIGRKCPRWASRNVTTQATPAELC